MSICLCIRCCGVTCSLSKRRWVKRSWGIQPLWYGLLFGFQTSGESTSKLSRKILDSQPLRTALSGVLGTGPIELLLQS